MSEHDDDLARWADDDLVRALRAPGTMQELGDQEQYVAAYRAAVPTRPRLRSLPRRAAGRLGAGGTAVVVTVALSSGVAAAYTGSFPDPVQRVVHSVLGPIGAPPPDSGTTHHAPTAGSTHGGGTVVVPPSSGTTSTSDPTTSPTAPTTGPIATGGPGHHHHPTRPGHGPTGAPPSTTPTTGPTSAPTGDPGSGSSAAGMTMGAATHRVGVGQPVTLSSLVTDVDGAPVAGQAVVLQVRAPRRWRPVGTATTDTTGTAVVTTAPVTRSARFRWHTRPHVHSPAWQVRMVPTLTTTADIGATSTVISAASDGGQPGDQVLLLRWTHHHVVVARRGRLDLAGSAGFQVATPQRRVLFVVRLLPTQQHAPARARVSVLPPVAASVSVVGASHRVAVGGSLTLSGVVRTADGTALPGRRVALQARGPRGWRPVAKVTTDAGGSVAFATPPARVTVRYRLRLPNGVHSGIWRVAMVPTLGASAAADGTIDANATGGFAGDRVLLQRRLKGRLVTVQHGTLDASGHVTFDVSPRPKKVTYVVRLPATKRHAWAVARATVPGTG
jgi:hypothetical protein